MVGRKSEVVVQDFAIPADRIEESANRILEAFGLEVVSDDEFDALCDLVEAVGPTRSAEPAEVCRLVAAANLSPNLAAATLLTLLKEPFRRSRDRLARVAEARRVASGVLG